jgi:multicomponent Na+:H+ antiporter subunit D
MPWTMAAFTTGSLGMIGVPPLAGFISKWYLGAGGLAAGKPWVIAILVTSSLLNAAYFLPIIYRGWFLDPAESISSGPFSSNMETHWMLLFPPLLTALLALLAGLLANAPFSPLEWARLIAAREYHP